MDLEVAYFETNPASERFGPSNSGVLERVEPCGAQTIGVVAWWLIASPKSLQHFKRRDFLFTRT